MMSFTKFTYESIGKLFKYIYIYLLCRKILHTHNLFFLIFSYPWLFLFFFSGLFLGSWMQHLISLSKLFTSILDISSQVLNCFCYLWILCFVIFFGPFLSPPSFSNIFSALWLFLFDRMTLKIDWKSSACRQGCGLWLCYKAGVSVRVIPFFQRSIL